MTKEITLRYYQTEAIDAVVRDLIEDTDYKMLVALETGTGKSYAIAGLCDRLIKMWDINILILGPNSEIITQDESALLDFLPSKMVGVYSASLGRRERKQVTVASIGSIHKKATLFQKIDIIIVDEVHLVSHKAQGMYRSFFAELTRARIVGFSATIYRLGHGYIHEGEEALFNKLSLDYTSMEHFNKLVDDGYLAKLISKGTDETMDTSDLHTRMGDFIEKEMSEKFDTEELNNRIIEDLLPKAAGYRKWLIFCIDIAHAENINALLLAKGIASAVVHSKMTANRGEVVDKLRNGVLQCLVNVNTLTTGLDIPDIDLIAMLRPTKSPVLYKQIAGRGLRPHPDKEHCLFLDYAGVVPLLGPINDIRVKQKKKGKKGGEPIIKECPQCRSLVAPAVRLCPECGHVFEFKMPLTIEAGTADIVKEIKEAWIKVTRVGYSVLNNPNNSQPPYLKVEYYCGMQRVTESVCLDHRGSVQYHAQHWVKYRWIGSGPPPLNVVDAHLQCAFLKQPTEIKVKYGKYTNVTDYNFN